jgi:ABC-2 type transport system ATP-binding protein
VIIETRRAAKWYGQVMAVSDVTLTVEKGITGLLGPNGAGKSTLLKMMVGQLAPSRGEVKLLGERVWGNPPLLRRIGYCPEHEGAWDELTAREAVTALTELHGIARADAGERADRVLRELDLGAALDRRLGEFSKGMRQRVKIAQALAHDPEVLFLDEPLTGCDPLARVKVLEVIRARAERGCSVILSSHVLHEIEALTTQILLMHKGKVLAEGDIYQIRELIDRHPHKVRVECDRPRQLGEALACADHVLALAFERDALTVETRDPDRCYPAIPDAARAAGVTIRALTSPDNNLAAVFRYLTEERA